MQTSKIYLDLSELTLGCLGYLPDHGCGDDVDIVDRPCSAGEDHPWDIAMQLLDSATYELSERDLMEMAGWHRNQWHVVCDHVELYQSHLAQLYLNTFVPHLKQGWALSLRRIRDDGLLDIDMVLNNATRA